MLGRRWNHESRPESGVESRRPAAAINPIDSLLEEPKVKVKEGEPVGKDSNGGTDPKSPKFAVEYVPPEVKDWGSSDASQSEWD